jgi:hypothetical protein
MSKSIPDFTSKFLHGYTTKRGIVIAACLIIFLLVSVSIVVVLTDEKPDGITADGKFSDWEGTPMYSDGEDQQSPGIDIISVAVHEDDDHLSFYMETSVDMFQGVGSEGDTMRVFIDTDADASTGYSIERLGADYLIEIYGLHNDVFSSNYYMYDLDHRTETTRDNHDWNAWASMFLADSEAKGTKVEVQLWVDELGIPAGIDPLCLIQLADPLGNMDYSPVFSRSGSVSAEIAAGTNDGFMELTLSNHGEKPVDISGITFTQDSTATINDIEKVTLINGLNEFTVDYDGPIIEFSELDLQIMDTEVFTLVLQLSENAESGHAVSLQVTDIASPAGITYPDSRVADYIHAAPQTPVVDGLFDEWTDTISDDTGETSNPNVDISEYDARNHEEITYFYLQVVGRMLAGNAVPATRAMNVPSDETGEPSGTQDEDPLPVESGEDAIYIFLDTIPDEGYQHYNLPFGADFMVEIKGQDGSVCSARYLEFDGERSSQWSWRFVKEVTARSSSAEIETMITGEPSGVYFHLVDWSGEEEDYSSHAIDTTGVTHQGVRVINLSPGTGGTGEEIGTCVVAGDFNDDGDMDVAMGAPNYWRGSDHGRVYIYYGDGTGVFTTEDVELAGASNNMEFGWCLAVGDFDGADDGDDLAVGAPKTNSGRGAVFIFEEGGSDGESSTNADVTINGEAGGDRFGHALVTGNFDDGGDDDDLAISAPSKSTSSGKVYVYYDADNNGADQTKLATGGIYFGASLAKGDFDNDGDADDLVVGASGKNNDKGEVYIYEDADFTDQYSNIVSSTATEYNLQRFGSALAVGDFDADGHQDDLLVGAYKYYYIKSRGRAYLYYDGEGPFGVSGSETFDVWTDTTHDNEQFGYAVASGDIDGNGADDAIIGAPGWTNDRGRVYVFYGEDENMDDPNDIDHTLEGSVIDGSQKMGYAITTAMIVDNHWNGLDIIVGAPGYSSNKGRTRIFENEDDLGIPEFSTVVVPVAGMICMFFVIRRRGQKSTGKEKPSGKRKGVIAGK